MRITRKSIIKHMRVKIAYPVQLKLHVAHTGFEDH
jgi:hypothetical protein